MEIILLFAILVAIVFHGRLHGIMNLVGKIAIGCLVVLLANASCTKAQAADLCSLPQVQGLLKSRISAQVVGFIGFSELPSTPPTVVNDDRGLTLTCQAVVTTTHGDETGYAVLSRQSGQKPELAYARWVSPQHDAYARQQLLEAQNRRREFLARNPVGYCASARMNLTYTDCQEANLRDTPAATQVQQIIIMPQQPQWEPHFERYSGPYNE